ncbi:WD40 repeat-like protein [Gloeophyllum trabeum ATCC 11539]|uniref:methylated diphthine methylhydrolase n=1 Tax=Gloeophyllum trabeum (strain ATCC 11539 / FP-39264 / Madison 617) TaxID=670483 RepID=S7QN23_GLOTA|nr:WD40 repeat-like protein [Gloeophyllum trabeum ATCC 11539]EPQ60817.1 WD40 repeat-like protein [Gloeophyllum trabeum ATCC 11539]
MRPPIDTDYPAVSAEFCPALGFRNVLACGTYRLQSASESTSGRSKQTRVGRCLIYKVHTEGGEDELLEQVQDIEMPGILDMKWCHQPEDSAAVLGIADADGFISLHQWNLDEGHLNKLHSTSLGESDALCLSLDWSNRCFPSRDLGSVVVSLSDGTLSILKPENSTGLVQVESWSAHDFEPWIAAWNYWDDNIIYSGGDDAKLKGWDIRQGFENSTFVYQRFDAGVTAIQSHPYVEHLYAVGSYDSTIRLFDSRKPLQPLQRVDVGGGVWRVKWHPSAERKHDLLAACMHDGFKVLHFEEGSESGFGSASISKRYDEHGSLAYGVDWCYSQDGRSKEGQSTLIASCSFYDHSLHLWRG